MPLGDAIISQRWSIFEILGERTSRSLHCAAIGKIPPYCREKLQLGQFADQHHGCHCGLWAHYEHASWAAMPCCMSGVIFLRRHPEPEHRLACSLTLHPCPAAKAQIGMQPRTAPTPCSQMVAGSQQPVQPP